MEQKGLQVFNFQEKQVRIVMRGSEPWWIGKDVCDILGYTNSRKALEDHCKHKGVTKCYTPGGEQEMVIIPESDVYRLIIRSNMPEAERFEAWVMEEILPSIRKTGSYQVKKTDNELELARKRLALQEKNANARLARVMQRMIESPKYPLTDDSKRILACDIAKLVTGEAHVEMLPDLSGKLRSNGDIAEELGISNRHVMKRGRALGFVAPEGEGNEYGTWKMSKSPNSSHECPQWFWSEAGRKRIIDSLRKTVA